MQDTNRQKLKDTENRLALPRSNQKKPTGSWQPQASPPQRPAWRAVRPTGAAQERHSYLYLPGVTESKQDSLLFVVLFRHVRCMLSSSLG